MKNSMMRRFEMVAMLAAVTAVAAPAQNAAARTFKVLYTFKGGTDGINPLGHLVMDTKGNLYGVTTWGGPTGEGGGIVFELSPPASGQTKWTETVLMNALEPLAGLIIDQNGALYGTNWAAETSELNVFKLTPPGSGSGKWTETILDQFDQYEKDGGFPDQPLAIDSQGRIYGTTADGGPHATGIVFMLTPSTTTKDGQWKETILYDFPTGSSQGNVTVDASGHVYGLDGSTLFKLTPPKAGDIYYGHETLAPVCDGDAVGLTPHGAEFFVTCSSGIYDVTPPKTGTTWETSTVYSFGTASTNPHGPTSAVTLGVNGELYVSTGFGGDFNHGAVLALKRPSSGIGPWTETPIHSMTGGSGGAYPLGSVFLDAKGNIYGTTYNGGNTDTSGPPKGGNHNIAPGDGIIYELPE